MFNTQFPGTRHRFIGMLFMLAWPLNFAAAEPPATAYAHYMADAGLTADAV